MTNVIEKVAIDIGNRCALLWDGKKVYKMHSVRMPLKNTDITGRKSTKEEVAIRLYEPSGDTAYVVGMQDDDAEFTYQTDKFLVAKSIFAGMMWQLPEVNRIHELIIVDSLPDDSARKSNYLAHFPKEFGWQTTDKKGETVDRKVTITNKISFVKEGMGAYLQKGVNKAMIVNMGGKTLDFVTITNGEVIESKSHNFDGKGAISFQSELQATLGGFTKRPYEMFQAFENGGKLTYIEGLDLKEINIKSQAEEYCTKWIRENVSQAIIELGGLPKNCPILLTGGLAYLVEEAYRDNPVIEVVKNPDTANVRVFS